MVFSRREFIDAGEPEIGAIMLFTAMDGSEMPGVIREVNGDSITVDFNHLLAGRTVHFDIEAGNRSGAGGVKCRSCWLTRAASAPALTALSAL